MIFSLLFNLSKEVAFEVGVRFVDSVQAFAIAEKASAGFEAFVGAVPEEKRCFLLVN